jgi:hypothetical protein
MAQAGRLSRGFGYPLDQRGLLGCSDSPTFGGGRPSAHIRSGRDVRQPFFSAVRDFGFEIVFGVGSIAYWSDGSDDLNRSGLPKLSTTSSGRGSNP